MQRIAVLIALVPCFGADYREFTYTPDTMPTWYVSQNAYNSASGHVWPRHISYNGARNANLRGDWRRPGGTRRMLRVGARRTLRLPIGGDKVQVRGRRWTFPEGAIISEQLFDEKNQLFAERAREKIGGEWVTIQDDILHEPQGYQAVTRDCRECHSQAGKRPIDGTSSQYRESLRGSDGVFSFSPIDRFGNVRPGLKDFVHRK